MPAGSTALAAYATFAAAQGDDICSLRCTVEDESGESASDLCDALLGSGAQSASVEEFRPQGLAEQPLYSGSERRVWERCTVTTHFPPGTDVAAALKRAAAWTGRTQPLRYQIAEVVAEEWVQTIRDSYRPSKVADRLWIIPDWCEPPDAGAVNVRLEPGLAFGTGEHPTTRLCLRWLHARRSDLAGRRVMDYGTGSGVLAVAALLLGAESAAATDVDPLAVRAAGANAALNGVADRLVAVPCEADPHSPEPLRTAGALATAGSASFDVCVANILQGPLLALAPRLAGYSVPGGLLALSGILAAQAPAVQAAYAPYFSGFELTC
ncbi:hypothetical protein WJX81_002386 [Elliptochloris bilobata]|uniref:ETFB lysine methyltransferase n=1 Tax=Elliptochloris bilobata TaxID=381761 RepID=A0AAW1RWG4_9CHLO